MNEKDFICPICGEVTSSYMGKYRKDRLCKKHAKELKDGLIVQCEDCGAWHEIGKKCNCKKQHVEKEKTTESSSELTCIICGEPSNGKHFCKSCYYKYKDKVVYLQIKKCIEFNKLDAEYQSDFTCDDGHLVKSPYEKIIDDWLFKEGINHAYETTLNVDKEHDIHPDFYIPEYNGIKDIYIEFWGYDEDNIKYTETKKYKEAIYPKLCQEEKITVLYLTKPDLNNASATLKKKLKYIEAGKVN